MSLRPSNLIRVMPAKGEIVDADVVIVGGGVIGTAIAWRGASAGLSVTLIDPDQDADKASLVAAGMLGPVSESVFGERDLLALILRLGDSMYTRKARATREAPRRGQG